MVKYETAVLKEVIVEAILRQQDTLVKHYPDVKDIKDFFGNEKLWKRTRKGNLKPNEKSASTFASYQRGAIERAFDFESSGITLKAFVYTNTTDEELLGFRFIIIPTRTILDVSLK